MGKGKHEETAAALGQGQAEGSFSPPAAFPSFPSFLSTSATSQDVLESSGRSMGRLEEYSKPC